jgi:hypothetical protein
VAVVSSSLRPTDWRISAIETQIASAHAGQGSLVSRNRPLLRLGQVSYWSGLIATLIVAVAGIFLYVNDEWHAHTSVTDRLVAILGGFVKGEWIGRVAEALWAHPSVLVVGASCCRSRICCSCGPIATLIADTHGSGIRCGNHCASPSECRPWRPTALPSWEWRPMRLAS